MKLLLEELERWLRVKHLPSDQGWKSDPYGPRQSPVGVAVPLEPKKKGRKNRACGELPR